MASKATLSEVTSDELEAATIMLLSDAVKAFSAEQIADSIVIVIPDTGKSRFNGSHSYVATSGKDKGETKMSKATFVVAELGSSYSGVESPLMQDAGDAKRLPLSIKLSVIATPPNRDGKTVDEALNRPTKLEAVA